MANMGNRAKEMKGDFDDNQSEFVTVEKPVMNLRYEPGEQFDE